MIFEGAVKYYEVYAVFPNLTSGKVFVGYSTGVIKLTRDAFYYPTFKAEFTYQENGIARKVPYTLSSDGLTGFNMSNAVSVEFKHMQCAYDSDAKVWLEPTAV